MLRVANADVFYGDVQVLWGVSFEVREGEVVALIGATNGAGKSTTLKTVSGLLRPRRGSVEFGGERIDQIPPYRVIERGIAHVPEARRLFPQMSVEENLELGALKGEARLRREETLGSGDQSSADRLVIGRPVTRAPVPREAFDRILDEISSV